VENDEFERRAIERRRSRGERRWESRLYFIGFGIALLVCVFVIDSWWLRLGAAAVGGLIVAVAAPAVAKLLSR
jgi:Flp pilus assembly protein TadB